MPIRTSYTIHGPPCNNIRQSEWVCLRCGFGCSRASLCVVSALCSVQSGSVVFFFFWHDFATVSCLTLNIIIMVSVYGLQSTTLDNSKSKRPHHKFTTRSNIGIMPIISIASFPPFSASTSSLTIKISYALTHFIVRYDALSCHTHTEALLQSFNLMLRHYMRRIVSFSLQKHTSKYDAHILSMCVKMCGKHTRWQRN